MADLITQNPAPSTLSNIVNRSGAKSSSEALPLEILYNLQYQHKWTDLKLHQLPSPSSSSSSSSTLPSRNGGTNTPPILDSAPLDFSPLSISGLPISDASSPLSSVSPLPLPSSSSRSTTSPSTPSSSSSSSPTTPQIIISGLPPRQIYIHPDHLSHLVSRSIPPESLSVEREYVLPAAIGSSWSLRKLAGVFDALPERTAIRYESKAGDGERKKGKSSDGGGEGNREGEEEEKVESGRDQKEKEEGNGKGNFVHRDSKRVLLGMLGRNGMGGDGTVVYYIIQEGEVKPRQN